MTQKAKFKIILNKKPSQKYTFREGKHLQIKLMGVEFMSKTASELPIC